MEIKAQLNYLRIAPRKVRSVVDLIRGKEIREAEHQLRFLPRKSSAPILKLLKSAIANAKSNFNIDKENLFIKNILVNAGVPFRRWRSMSRGRTYPIMKRTSNIIIVLGVKEGAKIRKPDKSPKDILTGPPQSGGLGGEETKTISKTAVKKPAKITSQKPKKQNWVKRIFRRKSM
jgi:large subunit ribosomal protein L22